MSSDTTAAVMKAGRRVVYVVALFSLGVNLLMLTAPLYMLQIFDRVLTSRSQETLIFLTIAAAIAFLTLGILEAVRSQIMVRLSSWLDRQFSAPLLADSLNGTPGTTATPSVERLRDLANFRVFVSSHALFSVFDAPWTPLFLLVIFMLHPLIGWIALIGASLLVVLALLNEFSTRGPLRRSGAAFAHAAADTEAALRNADVVRAMGMVPRLVQRWQHQNDAVLGEQESASLRSGRVSALARSLRQAMQVGVFCAGAWLVLENELTPGAMIAGSILTGRALAPIDMAIGSWKSARTAMMAWGRVRQALKEMPDAPSSMPLPAPKGRLTVTKLMFGWPGAREPLLRNLNFSLEPGQVLGLIGPTATGNTTLGKLIIGNLAPNAGHARLDGVDVSTWARDDIGPHIGYLPQDVELFAGTVRTNIARLDDGDPERVIEAAQRAGVHDLILSLPKGYETEIGPAGAVLSGGQRQRIALARALYGDPKLVVLDEPGASLDNDGEVELIRAVQGLKERGATVVIIAHRPNALRLADFVLVLKNGTMDKFGPRDEILGAVAAPPRRAGRVFTPGAPTGKKPEQES